MNGRTYLVLVIALLIFWQGNCLTYENGTLVNRCGVWQRITGKPMLITLDDLRERTVIKEVEKEKVVIREVPVEVPGKVVGPSTSGTTSNVVTFYGSVCATTPAITGYTATTSMSFVAPYGVGNCTANTWSPSSTMTMMSVSP